MRMTILRSTASLAIAAMGIGSALAADTKLPPSISWTAYGTTSSGYAQSVGLGKMLKEKYNADLRIIPGKNDVSRMVPLKAGQTPICACGVAAFFAQEGALMFGTKDWGPMQIHNLFNNVGTQRPAVDDRGRRRHQDRCRPEGQARHLGQGRRRLNMNATAMLAFGGLTWNDVVKVEVPGWGQSSRR